MAIPIRTTITCPMCNTTEDVTFGDASVGPGGRISETPIYSMFKNELWPQTKRDGETYLSCATCGAVEFATLAQLAKIGRGAGPKGNR